MVWYSCKISWKCISWFRSYWKKVTYAQTWCHKWWFCKIIVCNLLSGLPPDVSQVHQPILVCTAHIHWDPEFCDVKLIQTMMLSNELRSILEEASHNFRPGHKPDTNNIQLLLCGDFNSLPDSGKLYILLQNQYFHVSIVSAYCCYSVHSLVQYVSVVFFSLFKMS